MGEGKGASGEIYCKRSARALRSGEAWGRDARILGLQHLTSAVRAVTDTFFVIF